MKNRLLILSLLVSVPAFAWQPQTGDIIFQISRSSQSKAIQLATHSDYSHTGMLVMRNKKPYIFEAVGPVKYTPLKQWIAHGEKGKYVVRRVEGGLSVEQQQKLAQTAKRYLGKPYEVHTLDMGGQIVEHYKSGQPLPGELEKARSLALRGGYDFIEVYVGSCRCISANGAVSVVSL